MVLEDISIFDNLSVTLRLRSHKSKTSFFLSCCPLATKNDIYCKFCQHVNYFYAVSLVPKKFFVEVTLLLFFSNSRCLKSHYTYMEDDIPNFLLLHQEEKVRKCLFTYCIVVYYQATTNNVLIPLQYCTHKKYFGPQRHYMELKSIGGTDEKDSSNYIIISMIHCLLESSLLIINHHKFRNFFFF